jgi:hypothetical protein
MVAGRCQGGAVISAPGMNVLFGPDIRAGPGAARFTGIPGGRQARSRDTVSLSKSLYKLSLPAERFGHAYSKFRRCVHSHNSCEAPISLAAASKPPLQITGSRSRTVFHPPARIHAPGAIRRSGAKARKSRERIWCRRHRKLQSNSPPSQVSRHSSWRNLRSAESRRQAALCHRRRKSLCP